MNTEAIKKEILALEKELMAPGVRRSAERIAALLDAGFIEYCSSGKIYRYQPGDVFDSADAFGCVYEIENFELDLPGEDIAFARYEAIRSEPGKAPVRSLRSSIWQRRDGRWKMWFHQGTRV